MTKKIFNSILITAFISLLVVISLFFNVLYQNFEKQTQNNLKTSAHYIANAYYNEGLDYFDTIKTTDRITIIDINGKVIYDNHANNETMENHYEREEFKEALVDGHGEAIRYSQTLGNERIYYALKLKDNNILRLSCDQKTTFSILLGLSSHIMWIALLAIIIAYLFAKRASKSILKPINEMDINDNQIAPYNELQPLLNRIQSQNNTIKNQLKKLKTKEEELSLITQNMQEALIVINKNAQVLSHNKAALKIFNLNDFNDGNNIYEFYHSSAFIKAIEDVLKDGLYKELDLNLDNKEYELSISPVIIDNKVQGATILVIDITEKSKNERMRKEFSANVSHELKTPLTSIIGFAEIMKNGLVDEKDVKDIAFDIYKEANRLMQLVNDIIHLSKIEESNLNEKISSFNLDEVISHVIELLKHKAKSKNISINYDHLDIEIKGIYSVIEEIFYNLIDNSINYGKNDGHTDIKLEVIDNYVQISISDDGIGISEQDQERIFERFYRAEKSHNKEVNGSGLGLSIVKHGILLHDGSITVNSKIGEGSEFIIKLPL